MSDSSSSTANNQDGIAVKETSNRNPRAVCQFYSRGKWCQFGSRCRFLHQRQPKPKTSKPHSTKQSEGNHEGLKEFEKLSLLVEVDSFSNSVPIHSAVSEDKAVCKFFVKHRFCGYGLRCRFSHDILEKPNPIASSSSQKALPSSQGPDHEEKIVSKQQQPFSALQGPAKGRKGPRKPLCRYVKRGGCSLGDRCKFYHPSNSATDDVNDALEIADVSGKDDEVVAAEKPKGAAPSRGGHGNPQSHLHRRTPIYRRSGGPQFQFKLAEQSQEDLETLRQREIEQLLKRFPKATSFVDEKGRDGFTVTFVPTDPDWPYDVKHLNMNVIFAKEYPAKRLQVKLAEDEVVPDTVKRQVWFGMQDWLTSRFDRLAENGVVELVFKPLLRLLDRSLEDLFTEGLKLYKKELMARASGIELVSASILNDRYNQSSDEEEEDEEMEETDEEEADYESCSEDESSVDGDDHEEGGKEFHYPGNLDPVKRGIEVKLKDLQLKEKASTLRMYFAKLVLQCARCRNNAELKLPTNTATVVVCSKCHEEQVVLFRPGMAHQFCSVLGFLDAENCSPVDLILHDCLFMVGCLECSSESKVEGLPHGQLKTVYCTCHKKLQIAVESTRFTQLQSSDYVDIRGAVVIKAKKKNTRDPAIQEGKPLPNDGTCKHYKKSFRWLRFPCCGKAYPCDECHDETEDHEMQFANRMICGFCAKEQAFAANRDCIMCGSNMTKKTSSHWEGGKGCRDVIKMSRGDKKKYASSNKTVSKKSLAKPKSGKITKLRRI